MYRPLRGGLLLIALTSTLALFGCAAGDRKESANAHTEDGKASAAASEPAKAEPTDPKEEAEKVEKERRDLTRKLAKAKREMDAGQQRLKRTKLTIEHSEINSAIALRNAEHDLELARRKRKTFVEKSVPERLSRADLGFAGAQDGFKEADEEYKQLEMMYKEDQFADKTKEIVLDRGKRRLERAKRSLELDTASLAVLKDETIPVELIEQEDGVRDKEEAIAKLRREKLGTDLDNQMSLFSAEGEIIRLTEELEDAERDLADFERKQKEKAEKAASQPASEKSAK